MHKNFADWYRIISIDPQQVDLDARWRGIENYRKKLNKEAALDVVRRMFGGQPRASDFDARFRATFKKADSSFAMRDNDLEIEVLAASMAAHLLDVTDKNLADLVALAIVCADFQGSREEILLKEVVESAKAHLYKRSNDLRVKPAQLVVQQLKNKVSNLVNDSTAITTKSDVTKMLKPTLDELYGWPNQLVKPINDTLSALAEQLFLQQEEANMLWWLFTSYSRNLKLSVSSIELAPACVVMGKELADLTNILPGPIAAEAFLDKILASAQRAEGIETVTVRSAVSAGILHDWKAQLSKENQIDFLADFCSLNYALRQAAEDEEGNEWEAKFLKRSHIQVDRQLPSMTLALQMYRERLLIKAVQQQKND